MRADGADGGQLLLGAEPLLDLDGTLAWHVHIDGQVLEGTGERAQLAGDLDGARAHAGRDSLRDLDGLARVDRPHFGGSGVSPGMGGQHDKFSQWARKWWRVSSQLGPRRQRNPDEYNVCVRVFYWLEKRGSVTLFTIAAELSEVAGSVQVTRVARTLGQTVAGSLYTTHCI